MSFCEHCVDLKEIPGSPSGSESKVGGVNTYVAKGDKKGSIVVATDIYGLGIVNPKIVADKFASASGFTVYVPDIFPGGPISPKDFVLPKKAADGAPDEATMKANFDNFGKWMGKGNGVEQITPIFQGVVKELSKEGPVGIVGYCLGGKVVTLTTLALPVKGTVIYHPAMLEAEEADKIKTPVLLNMAELDPLFEGDLKSTWEKTLSSNKTLDSRSKTYTNTVHGFGSRPDVNDAKVKASWEESIDNTAQFFSQVLA